ncbi:MAG: aminoacyl-tRNA deacylase [Actinomycetota bacterium]
MATVAEHLQGRGVPFELIPHERTYTSIEEAQALGIAADEVLKTIVLDTAAGHALAVIPASQRLDIKRTREAVGDTHARFATEEEMERDFPGYELGALPPLGSLLGAPTYVDLEVLEHTTVVFAAGNQKESVKVRTEDLFRDEPHTPAPLTKAAKE